jgi:hypothetical protein
MAEQTTTNPSTGTRLTGIGGWLLLLIIKLWIGAVIRFLGGIAEPTHPVGVLNLVFGALGGAAAYLLGSKNSKGVMLAKIVLAADALYYVLELLPPISVANPFKTAGFLVASILYVAYLFGSERVKNTYFSTAGSQDR